MRPSRKFAVIGVSMISPEGLAIRPRMPASWRICCGDAARARVGHDVDRVEAAGASALAVASSVDRLGAELAASSRRRSVSVTSAQMSTTLL